MFPFSIKNKGLVILHDYVTSQANSGYLTRVAAVKGKLVTIVPFGQATSNYESQY